MTRIILIALFILCFSGAALAHTAFTLVSSEKKTVKESDLAGLEKTFVRGIVEKSNLTFSEKEIRLIVITGPEDDMLSYRIQGIRNPNLVVPAGAVLKILFINVDFDMRHDVRFGDLSGEFALVPEIGETAGSTKLTPRSEENIFQAEEIVIKSNDEGAFRYFCSVRGHAKGGMWGNIFVGVKPGANVKMPEKKPHVHSPDEDKETPQPAEKKPEVKKPAAHGHEKKDGETSEMSGMHGSMRSTINIGEPMSREGSGTSWVPDSSPMYAWMKMYEDGSMLMVQGTMFFRYTSIGSSRDVSIAGKGSRSRFDAPSMFMAMYSKPLSERSQIGLRAMFSLDPLLERGYGYPLLYQSAETFRGRPLHDRQHPHELINELSASYSYKFDEKNSAFFYAGYPGEPALGPPMFMHRVSGMNTPDSPIGHHWQDSTHIVFGVLTAGFTHKKIKFEASVFNGTEPDENRWAFDPPKLNSFSGRLSFNPSKQWSLQISHGYLKFPERAEPDLKVIRRTTASAIHNKNFSDDRNWANTFVWGRNSKDEGNSNALLFESNYEFYKNAVFGRVEQVEKNAHELVLAPPHPEGNFWVGAYSIGYLRDIIKNKDINLSLGGMATFNTNPTSIGSFYGGTKHAGWQFFIRLRPSAIR